MIVAVASAQPFLIAPLDFNILCVEPWVVPIKKRSIYAFQADSLEIICHAEAW